jgi:hypothetical protein
VWRRKGFLADELPQFFSIQESSKPSAADFKPLADFAAKL